jgi:hypothetical protein
MALGTETDIIAGQSYAVEMMASVIAANNPPSGAAGISVNQLANFGSVPQFLRCAVVSTAGSGTMTVTVRIWMRLGAIGWIVARPFNASSAAPQTAVAISETSADSIAYSEVVELSATCDRLYMEVVAIAGTNTAVTGYALVGR